jgi:hypothetical protein
VNYGRFRKRIERLAGATMTDADEERALLLASGMTAAEASAWVDMSREEYVEASQHRIRDLYGAAGAYVPRALRPPGSGA